MLVILVLARRIQGCADPLQQRPAQLESVTVSAVPDDESSQVGGLQNTSTNLGASLGTALAGSLLIAILTTSFLSGIAQNPAVPAEVAAQANVELAGGIPLPISRRR